MICAYNSEQFLRDAAESVMRQSYTHLELIIVDDGSTDATFDVASELARSDARVRLIKLSDNQGVALARQVGLDGVNSEWVMFVDADDVARPELLGRLVDAITEDPDLVAVGCWAYYVGPNFRVGQKGAAVANRAFGINRVGPASKEEFLRRVDEGKLIVLLSPTLFSVREAKEAGGYRLHGFPEHPSWRWRDISEDVDLWCRMAQRSADERYMMALPEPLFYLRKRRGSLTTRHVLATTQKNAWIKDGMIRGARGLPSRSFNEYTTSLSPWSRLQQLRSGYGASLYQRAGFAFAVDKKRARGLLLASGAALLAPTLVLKRLRALSSGRSETEW